MINIVRNSSDNSSFTWFALVQRQRAFNIYEMNDSNSKIRNLKTLSAGDEQVNFNIFCVNFYLSREPRDLLIRTAIVP